MHKLCTVLLLSASIVVLTATGQTKTAVTSKSRKSQNNKRQLSKGDKHFNMAQYAQSGTLIKEKHLIPGTDSVVTEQYYVWLLPKE